MRVLRQVQKLVSGRIKALFRCSGSGMCPRMNRLGLDGCCWLRCGEVVRMGFNPTAEVEVGQQPNSHRIFCAWALAFASSAQCFWTVAGRVLPDRRCEPRAITITFTNTATAQVSSIEHQVWGHLDRQ